MFVLKKKKVVNEWYEEDQGLFFLLEFGYNPDKRTGLHQQIVC